MIDDPILRIEHIQEARRRHGGYCTPGLGAWFAHHGMSLRHLLREGYPVSMIETVGDPFGQKVADICREMSKKGGT